VVGPTIRPGLAGLSRIKRLLSHIRSRYRFHAFVLRLHVNRASDHHM